MRERRPSASSTASGQARTMDKVVSISVSGRPPQRSVGTGVRPATPPSIKAKNTAHTSTQASSSQRFQKRRMPLATTSSSNRPVASIGRHCSSSG
ncbi:hypothetical protein D3C71_1882770 [compost metagenome]